MIMQNVKNQIDRAIKNLYFRRNYTYDNDNITISHLLRFEDWRPLRADWWKGKEVCIIGADIDGNFFFSHCDGSVRYWCHQLKSERILSKSIEEFVSRISP